MALNPAARALALRSAAMQHRYAPLIPGRHPVLTPAAPKPQPRRPVSQTASQVANQQVTAALAPQIAAANATARQQQQVIQQWGAMLLGKLQPIAGQVGQDYNQAIGQVGALSGAAADALRNANPNQQDQQLLQSLNAPQSQQQQVAGQLANAFNGGAAVTQVNQGVIPVTQLASDKASQQAYSRQLPLFAGTQTTNDLRAAQVRQNQDIQQINTQRPGLYQTALQNIQKNQSDRATAAWDQQKFWQSRADALGLAGDKAAAAAAQHKADLAYKYAAQRDQNLRTQATIEGQNIRAANALDVQKAQGDARNRIAFTKVNGYDPATGKVAPGFKITAGGRVVKTASAPKAPHLTAKQRQDYMGTAATIAENAKHGFTPPPTTANPTPKAVPPIGFTAALDEMDKEGIPRPIAIQALMRWYNVVNPKQNPKALGPPAP